MNFRNRILHLLIFSLLTVPVFGQAVIKAGRAIEVSIQGIDPKEKPRIDGRYLVGADGRVRLPYLADRGVQAAGLRPDELAMSLQAAYKRDQIFRTPTIQVFAAEQEELDMQVVHVGGKVKNSGAKEFAEGLTLWQAIQAAGGATEFGSMRRVRLFRDGKIRQYDVTKPDAMQIRLRPDDTIEVPEKRAFER